MLRSVFGVIIIVLAHGGSVARAACASPTAVGGQMQWSSSNSQVEFCDGSNWVSTAVVSTGNSCAKSGQVQYSTSPVDMQFCNGSTWMSMTSTLTNGSCSGTKVGTIKWNLLNSWMEWCDGFSWWPMIAQPNLNLNFMTGAMPIKVRFSRAITGANSSPGTYVTSAGSIALAPQNMLLRSQDLTSSWTITGGTVTSNATSAPDGAVSAGSFGETAASSTHLFYQNISAGSGQSLALSGYLKQGDGSRVPMLSFGFSGGLCFCHFDLSSSGSVLSNGTQNAAAFSAPVCSISSVGNGWYRAALVATSGSIQTVQAGLRFKTTDGGASSYPGDGVSGMYVWGMQVEEGVAATSYAYTTTGTAAGPRLDYDPTTVGSLNGLLIEAARTNLVWPSTLTIGLGSGASSVVSSSVVAPDSSFSNKVIEDSSTGTHFSGRTVTIGTAQAYSYSAFFKAAERTKVIFYGGKSGSPFTRGAMSIDLSAGTFSASTVGSPTWASNHRLTAYPNGWYRAAMTVNVDASSTDGYIEVRLVNGSGATSYAGDGSSGVYVWGLQIELGNYPSSYIPTSSAAVTRAADVATVPDLSWMSGQDGTLYTKAMSGPFLNDSNAGETQIVAALENSGAVGRLHLRRVASTAPGVASRYGLLYFLVGGQLVANTANGNWPMLTSRAAAVAFSGPRMRSAVEGSLVGSLVTSGTTFAPNAFLLGSSAVIGTNFGGWIQNVRYYPQVMTDGQLQRLTTFAPP